MAHILYCKDLGVDCPAEIRGVDTEEVLNKAVEHGQKEHGMKEFSPELMDRMRQAVKEEPATW
jgi:predicted small metal-binding protein